MKNRSLITQSFIATFFFALLMACGSKPEVKLEINSTDVMSFDKQELRVPAGSQVTLTLNHTGQMNKQSMGHNVVILKQGTNVTDFAVASIPAVDKGYIANPAQVIAHTELIGGGESSTITFDAPAKGSYDFICSFPGHYGVMKGKFIVE